MDSPIVEDHPPRPSDRTHLLLAERGSAILPEPANADGRVTLTDAMLAVAALAPCFALARTSIGLGLASIVVVLPALARTHVVMVRARGLGSSPGAGAWLFALVSSTIRVGMILGLVAVIHAASLTVGWSLGARPSALPGPSRWGTPGMASGGVPGFPFAGLTPFAGALACYVLFAIPLTLLALAYLVPRLLWVRDPV